METKMNSKDMYRIAEIELVYRSNVRPSERPVITTSRNAYEVLLNAWDPSRIEMVEQFKILLLNRSNKVLGIYELSSGGITGTVADPRLVFTAALKANAVSIVLCHNHPSGNLKPSREDEQLTMKIKEAGKFLDIKVFDHLVITKESYFSFAMRGCFSPFFIRKLFHEISCHILLKAISTSRKTQ